jgi:hypothetical protein
LKKIVSFIAAAGFFCKCPSRLARFESCTEIASLSA